MNAAGQTICLCMIVKNEAAVIRRSLDSARPLIDHWIVVDTGSTDGTQEIVREHMKGIPGSLHERAWKNFAHNRSEALALARAHADFTLTLDADDTLELPEGFFMPELTRDCYSVDIIDGTQRYPRNQLVNNRLEWSYRGVLHEFVQSNGPAQFGHLAIGMRRGHDGARRKGADVFLRDVAVLQEALRTEQDSYLRTRYTFYLAQSYRDAKQPLDAIRHYLERAAMGGWQEEVYYSLLQVARLKEQLCFADDDVLAAYEAAIRASATRVEALQGASRFCRVKGRHARGYEFARAGLGKPYPADSLFGEPWAYDMGLLDELSVNAYWTGRYQESLDVCLTLLGSGKVGAQDLARVAGNARYSLKGLQQQQRPPRLGPHWGDSLSDQHVLQPPRQLRSALKDSASVLVGLVARPDDPALPLHLACIESLEWSRSAMRVCIVLMPPATDVSERASAGLPGPVQRWIDRLSSQYAGLEVQAASELAGGRDALLEAVHRHGCDFLLMTTACSFLRPCTLRELVALGLPVVAPMLRALAPQESGANFSVDVDELGAPRACDPDHWIVERRVRGVIEVSAVTGSRLIRADIARNLRHADATGRPCGVIFADSARRAAVPQYVDNRQVYGYQAPSGAVLSPQALEAARRLISAEVNF